MVERILPRASARVEVRPGGRAGLGVASVAIADAYEDSYESAAPVSIEEPEPEAEFLDAVSDLDEDRYGAPGSPSHSADDEIYFEAEPRLEQLQPIPDEDTHTGGLPGIDSEPIIFSSPNPIPEATAFEQRAERADAPDSEEAADYPGEAKTDDYKEATDPWENPLPAWEYSANEYPVLLNENRPSSWKKIMVPAAVILFVALAAGYVLFFQPSSESQEAAAIQAPAQSLLPASEQSAGEQSKEPRVEQPQTEQPMPAPPPEAASTAPADSAPPAVAASGAESSGGAFSLQAASFPDEAAARHFSEYLASAGIPSRVVAAQLGRRGKWYRVRVGRFASPEEAEKYAVQARARSASLGMNFQLIVCDYEKP
ncbi:MAG TPA: SPOR domain-containing protein [Blastocatellia bacterium]|nr:SPOR domain-containing protein [Blastocatellia bacterium]